MRMTLYELSAKMFLINNMLVISLGEVVFYFEMSIIFHSINNSSSTMYCSSIRSISIIE